MSPVASLRNFDMRSCKFNEIHSTVRNLFETQVYGWALYALVSQLQLACNFFPRGAICNC